MSQALHKHKFTISLLLITAIGLVVRLILVYRSGWRLDYDEAMIGLLGLRVLRGKWVAFVPAQPTLGSLEAYLLASVFALFGATPLTFRIVSLELAAAYVLTTGLVGQVSFGRKVGAIAALLAAVAPPYMIITSLKTWGVTIETMILGNLLLVLASVSLRPTQQKIAYRLAITGLIAGIMFWISWLGTYYQSREDSPCAVGISLYRWFATCSERAWNTQAQSHNSL